MKRTFSLLVITCYIFLSCEKEDMQIISDDPVSSINSSRISFNTQADFDQAIDQLRDGKTLDFPSGFISLASSKEA